MRLEWIDRLKGLGIILVVLGHVVGGAAHLTEGTSRTTMEFLFKYIYAFHMPLFFFIAGLTFSTKGRTFGSFALGKVRRLLVPYFVFGTLSALLYMALQGSFNSTVSQAATDTYYTGKTVSGWWVPFVSLLQAGGWPDGNGFIANSVLWFLPCLFVLEIVGYGLDRLLPLKRDLLLMAVPCFGLAFLCRRYIHACVPWQLPGVIYYLPFFLLARCVPREGWFTGWTAGVRLAVGGAIVLALGGLCWIAPNGYFSYVRSGTYALYFGLAIIGIFGFGLLMQGWGGGSQGTARPTLGAVSHNFLTKMMTVCNKWLIRCGVATMAIMALHKFVVLVLQLKVPGAQSLYQHGTCLATCACLLITAVAVLGCLFADRLILRFAPWMLGRFLMNDRFVGGAINVL